MNRRMVPGGLQYFYTNPLIFFEIIDSNFPKLPSVQFPGAESVMDLVYFGVMGAFFCLAVVLGYGCYRLGSGK